MSTASKRKSSTAEKIKHANFDSVPASALSERMNWLRAGVLGANDGIISTASLILGVAGADATIQGLLLAGIAGMVAGALSMAVGEYVSVSTQRDTEKAAVELERVELTAIPDQELDELTFLLAKKGLSAEVARQAAEELTRHDALAAHAEVELGIKPGQYTNPWQAAAASAIAFALGAAVPLLAVWLTPLAHVATATTVAVSVALMLTGLSSAWLGRAPLLRAVVRNVMGGVIAMGVTYGVGHWVGTYYL